MRDGVLGTEHVMHAVILGPTFCNTTVISR